MPKEFIAYEDQGTQLEGFLAYPSHPSNDKKFPGVLICHAWRGRDQFVCDKAAEISEWGYAAFALDLYGKRVLGKSTEENKALMSPFINDRKFLQRRLQTALKTFQKHPAVDKTNIAVMGFCFGGLCALDLAREGSNLKGSISIHGLLKPREEGYSDKITAKILVLHGHDDPMVPPKDVLNFENEMTEAGADWQVHIYGNTTHAFTNPAANDPSFGTVFNPLSAKRAWQSIQNFLDECLS